MINHQVNVGKIQSVVRTNRCPAHTTSKWTIKVKVTP